MLNVQYLKEVSAPQNVFGDLKVDEDHKLFLRVLEYYSGILFLTTNRIGALNEAFKSRIHLSLYYQPPSKEQTLGIFEVNLRKLHTIEEDEQKLQADGEPTPPKQLVLEIGDFSIMHYADSNVRDGCIC
ncbi:hypothetical protein DL769_009300 [Monosporascus sp. CRB-8-3]|nr:hypothetical protein DL769_009300 [Monosporascus sp. CRB-8-3]